MAINEASTLNPAGLHEYAVKSGTPTGSGASGDAYFYTYTYTVAPETGSFTNVHIRVTATDNASNAATPLNVVI